MPFQHFFKIKYVTMHNTLRIIIKALPNGLVGINEKERIMKTIIATTAFLIGILITNISYSQSSFGGIYIEIILNGKITDYDDCTKDGEVTNLDNGNSHFENLYIQHGSA